MSYTMTMDQSRAATLMAVNPLYVQLCVPEGLEQVLEGLARQVLRTQPTNIYKFAAIYFHRLLLLRHQIEEDTGCNATVAEIVSRGKDMDIAEHQPYHNTWDVPASLTQLIQTKKETIFHWAEDPASNALPTDDTETMLSLSASNTKNTNKFLNNQQKLVSTLEKAANHSEISESVVTKYDWPNPPHNTVNGFVESDTETLTDTAKMLENRQLGDIDKSVHEGEPKLLDRDLPTPRLSPQHDNGQVSSEKLIASNVYQGYVSQPETVARDTTGTMEITGIQTNDTDSNINVANEQTGCVPDMENLSLAALKDEPKTEALLSTEEEIQTADSNLLKETELDENSKVISVQGNNSHHLVNTEKENNTVNSNEISSQQKDLPEMEEKQGESLSPNVNMRQQPLAKTYDDANLKSALQYDGNSALINDEISSQPYDMNPKSAQPDHKYETANLSDQCYEESIQHRCEGASLLKDTDEQSINTNNGSATENQSELEKDIETSELASDIPTEYPQEPSAEPLLDSETDDQIICTPACETTETAPLENGTFEAELSENSDTAGINEPTEAPNELAVELNNETSNLITEGDKAISVQSGQPELENNQSESQSTDTATDERKQFKLQLEPTDSELVLEQPTDNVTEEQQLQCIPQQEALEQFSGTVTTNKEISLEGNQPAMIPDRNLPTDSEQLLNLDSDSLQSDTESNITRVKDTDTSEPLHTTVLPTELPTESDSKQFVALETVEPFKSQDVECHPTDSDATNVEQLQIKVPLVEQKEILGEDAQELIAALQSDNTDIITKESIDCMQSEPTGPAISGGKREGTRTELMPLVDSDVETLVSQHKELDDELEPKAALLTELLPDDEKDIFLVNSPGSDKVKIEDPLNMDAELNGKGYTENDTIQEVQECEQSTAAAEETGVDTEDPKATTVDENGTLLEVEDNAPDATEFPAISNNVEDQDQTMETIDSIKGDANENEQHVIDTQKVIDILKSGSSPDAMEKPEKMEAMEPQTLEIIEKPKTLEATTEPQTLEITEAPKTFEVIEEPKTLQVIEEPLEATKEPKTLEVVEEPKTLAVFQESNTLEVIKEPKTLEVIEEPLEANGEPKTLEVVGEPKTLAVFEEPKTLEVIKEPKTLEVIEEPLEANEETKILEVVGEPKTLAVFEEPKTLDVIEEPKTLEVVEEPKTLGVFEEPNTLEVIDEPNTLEVIKEPNTLEVIEEPNTLEVIEEPNTLEVIEEPNTLQVIEEPKTLEVIEEPKTLAVFEEPKTLEVMDEPKRMEVTNAQQTFEATEEPQTLELMEEPKTLELMKEPKTLELMEPKILEVIEEPQTSELTEKPKALELIEEPVKAVGEPQTLEVVDEPNTLEVVEEPTQVTQEQEAEEPLPQSAEESQTSEAMAVEVNSDNENELSILKTEEQPQLLDVITDTPQFIKQEENNQETEKLTGSEMQPSNIFELSSSDETKANEKEPNLLESTEKLKTNIAAEMTQMLPLEGEKTTNLATTEEPIIAQETDLQETLPEEEQNSLTTLESKIENGKDENVSEMKNELPEKDGNADLNITDTEPLSVNKMDDDVLDIDQQNSVDNIERNILNIESELLNNIISEELENAESKEPDMEIELKNAQMKEIELANTEIQELDNNKMKEQDNTEMKELDNTKMKELENNKMKEQDNTEIKELDNTEMKELDNTEVEELDNSKTKELDNTEVNELDNTDSNELDNTEAKLDNYDVKLGEIGLKEPDNAEPKQQDYPNSTTEAKIGQTTIETMDDNTNPNEWDKTEPNIHDNTTVNLESHLSDDNIQSEPINNVEVNITGGNEQNGTNQKLQELAATGGEELQQIQDQLNKTETNIIENDQVSAEHSNFLANALAANESSEDISSENTQPSNLLVNEILRETNKQEADTKADDNSQQSSSLNGEVVTPSAINEFPVIGCEKPELTSACETSHRNIQNVTCEDLAISEMNTKMDENIGSEEEIIIAERIEHPADEDEVLSLLLKEELENDEQLREKLAELDTMLTNATSAVIKGDDKGSDTEQVEVNEEIIQPQVYQPSDDPEINEEYFNRIHKDTEQLEANPTIQVHLARTDTPKSDCNIELESTVDRKWPVEIIDLQAISDNLQYKESNEENESGKQLSIPDDSINFEADSLETNDSGRGEEISIVPYDSLVELKLSAEDVIRNNKLVQTDVTGKI